MPMIQPSNYCKLEMTTIRRKNNESPSLEYGVYKRPRTVNKSIYVFESNFDEVASIEQEHTSTEYQFNTFIPSYFIEESQPIQNNFFLNQ
ncbi:26965_t:CDS:2, partial [Gigaspora margarita]